MEAVLNIEEKFESISSVLANLKEKFTSLLRRAYFKREQASNREGSKPDAARNVAQKANAPVMPDQVAPGVSRPVIPQTVQVQDAINQKQKNEQLVHDYVQKEIMKVLQEAKFANRIIKDTYHDNVDSARLHVTTANVINEGVDRIFSKLNIQSDESRRYFLSHVKFNLFFKGDMEITHSENKRLNVLNNNSFIDSKSWIGGQIYPADCEVNRENLFSHCVQRYLKDNYYYDRYNDVYEKNKSLTRQEKNENQAAEIRDLSWSNWYEEFNGKNVQMQLYDTDRKVFKMYQPNVLEYLNVIKGSATINVLLDNKEKIKSQNDVLYYKDRFEVQPIARSIEPYDYKQLYQNHVNAMNEMSLDVKDHQFGEKLYDEMPYSYVKEQEKIKETRKRMRM